jgi:uncharacterized protein (DUF58 family)
MAQWGVRGSVPSLNRITSDLHQGRLTRRGAWALAAWVAIVLLTIGSGHPTLLPLAVGLFVPIAAAPVICLRRLGRVPEGLSLHIRAMPPMVPLGATCHLHIIVAGGNRSLPPLGLELPDRRWRQIRELPVLDEGSVAPELVAEQPVGRWAPEGRALLRLPPVAAGSSLVIERPVPTDVRGIFGLPRLRLWIGDPFGLFAFAGPEQRSAAIVVHPRSVTFGLPEPGPADARGTVGLASGQPVSRGPGDGPGDLAGLRPYRAGDRLHLVHWPSMAATGSIMVREFAPDGEQLVQIVVDDRVGTHRRHAFDVALSVTFALIAQANAEGFVSDLLTLSGYRTRIAPTAEGMAGLLPLLATLNPRVESDRPATPIPGWTRWDDAWPFERCTVVTTEAAATSLPPAVTAMGRIVTV